MKQVVGIALLKCRMVLLSLILVGLYFQSSSPLSVIAPVLSVTPSEHTEEQHCPREEMGNLTSCSSTEQCWCQASRDTKEGKQLLCPSTGRAGGAGCLWLHSLSTPPSPVTFAFRVLGGISAEALCLFQCMTFLWGAEGEERRCPKEALLHRTLSLGP